MQRLRESSSVMANRRRAEISNRFVACVLLLHTFFKRSYGLPLLSALIVGGERRGGESPSFIVMVRIATVVRSDIILSFSPTNHSTNQ